MLNIVARTTLGCALLLAAGCASKQKVDPSVARAAVYSTSFETLFQEVALEVKQHYPNLAAQPKEHVVKTAWHQMPMTETVEGTDDTLRYEHAPRNRVPGNKATTDDNFDQRRNFRRRNTTRETKYFVRFDVILVESGSPGSGQWQVKVTGQASVHDGTGIPVELKGEERPYWLDGRIADLEVAIHDRVKRLAVAQK